MLREAARARRGPAGSRQRGQTLVELAVATAIAGAVFSAAMGAVVLSLENFRACERRVAARAGVRQVVSEIERSLRASARGPAFSVRRGPAPEDPAAPTGTAGVALYGPAATGFDTAGHRAAYGDGFAIVAGPDTAPGASGRTAIFRKTWAGSTTFTAAPTRVERLCGDVVSLGFLDDGATVSSTVIVEVRGPDGAPVQVDGSITVRVK